MAEYEIAGSILFTMLDGKPTLIVNTPENIYIGSACEFPLALQGWASSIVEIHQGE